MLVFMTTAAPSVAAEDPQPPSTNGFEDQVWEIAAQVQQIVDDCRSGTPELGCGAVACGAQPECVPGAEDVGEFLADCLDGDGCGGGGGGGYPSNCFQGSAGGDVACLAAPVNSAADAAVDLAMGIVGEARQPLDECLMVGTPALPCAQAACLGSGGGAACLPPPPPVLDQCLGSNPPDDVCGIPIPDQGVPDVELLPGSFLQEVSIGGNGPILGAVGLVHLVLSTGGSIPAFGASQGVDDPCLPYRPLVQEGLLADCQNGLPRVPIRAPDPDFPILCLHEATLIVDAIDDGHDDVSLPAATVIPC